MRRAERLGVLAALDDSPRPGREPVNAGKTVALTSWKFPRLCRAGNSSLTFPTVAVERG
jgi:hypothetical protein